MSFNNVLVEDMVSLKFNSGPYLRTRKGRPHVSLSKVEAYENSTGIAIQEMVSQRYDGPLAKRYIAAKNVSYDLVASVYDVNSRSLAVVRMFQYNEELLKKLRLWINGLRNPNLEGRLAGLQNGSELHCLVKTVDLLMDSKVAVVEVDLFGAETRNLAVDAKLGTTYDILMDNRIYRPGERVTQTTKEEFEAAFRK